ncbi:MAG: hypothetical protein LUH10_00940 [Tannerellaceae bacterium]|nr:hypothetical protein [Tannerellaceae bacterium]
MQSSKLFDKKTSVEEFFFIYRYEVLNYFRSFRTKRGEVGDAGLPG